MTSDDGSSRAIFFLDVVFSLSRPDIEKINIDCRHAGHAIVSLEVQQGIVALFLLMLTFLVLLFRLAI